MLLRELTDGLNIIKSNRGGDAAGAERICTDNRLVRAGDCFVCIKGFVRDAHEFWESAVVSGASVVVMQDEKYYEEAVRAYPDKCFLLCESTRTALAILSSNINGRPSEKFFLAGITGTKGKTTTSYLLKNIFDNADIKTGLVGTMCNMVGDRVVETERTTPEANVLQPLFKEMAEEDVKVCVMEVSSQGLNLDRVGGCDFDIGVFTNLSPDHIGDNEHKDMDDYAAAKAKLFKKCRKGIVNIDSPYADVMMRDATCELYTYGIDGECDFKAVNIELGPDGVEYDITGICPKMHISLAIPGRFSVYNSLAAAAVSYLAGMSSEDIVNGLRDVVVKGKAETVPTGRDFTVMIDYAHNPDSFINIISTAKAFAKRTVFLFGCGGDRNRPRELMGKTAGEYADFTIITSDNPRSEDPASIVADIEKGIIGTGKPYVCIVNRQEAIEYAIENAQSGDVIILAGKGHETTQIFKDKTIHFDEREIVRDALKKFYG